MNWRILIVILFLPVLGVGCSSVPIDSVKDAVFQGARKTGQIIKESGDGIVRNLDQKQKQVIDQWLSANELNRYGDPVGTFYTGGTPLFDEVTGGSKDRFEHLFEKFPDLKDIIKNKE